MEDTWSDVQKAQPANPFKQLDPRVFSLSASYQYIYYSLRELAKC